MEKIYISSEILKEVGFHLTSGGRSGYGKSDIFAVFDTLENQSWFLDDCLGGDHTLYHIDLVNKKVEKLASYHLIADRFKWKNAWDWYTEITKGGVK